MEFFLNGAELSLNSENLMKHCSMNWAQFKDPISHMSCGTVVASWSFTQEVAGLSPFTVMTNVFVTEFSETFRKNSNVNTRSFTELSM